MTGKLRVLSVVAARPNFMKIAPFCRAMSECVDRLDHTLVHTGQHYDVQMSSAFFQELRIPSPSVNLGIGSGTHAEQVGRTMIEFEKVLEKSAPDWVVVVGDVNATLACAIAAKKAHVKLAHIEAGLRSFDMDMPEEINRIVTDRLADMLFTTDSIADGNLRAEGVGADRIRLVGNVMIDTMEHFRAAAAALDPNEIARMRSLQDLTARIPPPLHNGGFAVVTLHRPENVDHPGPLTAFCEFIAEEMARTIPVVWPLHPRTRKQMELFGLWHRMTGIPSVFLTEPLGYREMLRLNMGAAAILTDSGGLQEECCVLGTPCLTLRRTTERPITLREHGGVCELVGDAVEHIRGAWQSAVKRPRRESRPPLWDGHAAERIAATFRALAG